MSRDFTFGSKVYPGTAKLLEEMGELAEVLGKLMGSEDLVTDWKGNDIKTRLIEELGDVSAAIEFFIRENVDKPSTRAIYKRAQGKLSKYYDWHTANDNKRPTKELDGQMTIEDIQSDYER